MLEAGEILKVDQTGFNIGRPADLFAYNSDYMHVLGLCTAVHAGQCILEYAIADAYGKIITREEMPVETLDYERLDALVTSCMMQDPLIRAVGLGIPGHAKNGCHRSVRHHQIRPGVVQGGHVAIERGTAEDLHVRPQLAAIDGQIDVQVIVMRGHDDGRGFHDVRPLEHRQFPGIPENVTGIVRRHEPGVLLDETERQPATFQGIRRSFPTLRRRG